MMKPVFIIGFMGAGKTTFGKKLAAKLGMPFYDLDVLIEEHSGIPVQQLFAEKGEAYFRELESQMLRASAINAPFVMATGGGAPCFFGNINWMNEQGITVSLHLSVAALCSRLALPKNRERPLLQGLDDEQLRTFIEEKLREREPFYEQAQIKVDALRADLNGVIRQIREQ